MYTLSPQRGGPYKEFISKKAKPGTPDIVIQVAIKERSFHQNNKFKSPATKQACTAYRVSTNSNGTVVAATLILKHQHAVMFRSRLGYASYDMTGRMLLF